MPEDESKSAGSEEGATTEAPKLHRATREWREMLTRLEQPLVPYKYFPDVEEGAEGDEGVMVFRAIDVYDTCDQIDAEHSDPTVTLGIADHLDAAYDLAEHPEVRQAIKDAMEELATQESR